MAKRTLFAAAGGLLLTAASTPAPSPEAYFPDAPPATSSKLAALCMDARYSVQASDDHQVLCSKQVSGFKGALMQMVIGNSYSTTPQQALRFQMIPWGTGTRVQFGAWVETQMAFGQMRREPLDGRKITQEVLAALYARGATATPSSSGVTPLPSDVGRVATDSALAAVKTGGLGVAFLPSPAGLVIMAVAPGSAADNAGFKPGQVVQSVGGIDLRGMPSDAAIVVIKAQAMPVFTLVGGGQIKVAPAPIAGVVPSP